MTAISNENISRNAARAHWNWFSLLLLLVLLVSHIRTRSCSRIERTCFGALVTPRIYWVLNVNIITYRFRESISIQLRFSFGIAFIKIEVNFSSSYQSNRGRCRERNTSHSISWNNQHSLKTLSRQLKNKFQKYNTIIFLTKSDLSANVYDGSEIQNQIHSSPNAAAVMSKFYHTSPTAYFAFARWTIIPFAPHQGPWVLQKASKCVWNGKTLYRYAANVTTKLMLMADILGSLKTKNLRMDNFKHTLGCAIKAREINRSLRHVMREMDVIEQYFYENAA